MSNHRARKRFGQHFLSDPHIIDKIVYAINPKPQQALVEIGPGLGALSKPVLTLSQQLTVVELDRDVIPLLQHDCKTVGELIVHQADALDFDFCSLSPTKMKLRLFGNLPYNISTPLIFHLLTQKHCIDDMYFMLQKEVVDRLAAQPGTKNYGRLSVMVQYHCEVTPLFVVPPTAFKPPPKVDSAVVHLKPYTESPYAQVNEDHFANIVRQAFSQRRKTIRNTLKNIISEEQWEKLAIDPRQRAENLTILDFVNICISTSG